MTLCGLTTDGSGLYSTPLAEVFGDVPHQICTFHIVAEVNKAVLGAVARARKALAATQPKLPKGRPSTQAAKAAARTKKRLAAQGAALFTHRYLFVQRHLNKPNGRPCGASAVGSPVTGAASDHGAGICLLRSALSDPAALDNWPSCGGVSSGSPPSVTR